MVNHFEIQLQQDWGQLELQRKTFFNLSPFLFVQSLLLLSLYRIY